MNLCLNAQMVTTNAITPTLNIAGIYSTLFILTSNTYCVLTTARDGRKNGK